jgi:hypothetical protein
MAAAIVDDVDKVDSEIRLSLDSRHRWALNRRNRPVDARARQALGGICVRKSSRVMLPSRSALLVKF